jgi:dCMP deaminase
MPDKIVDMKESLLSKRPTWDEYFMKLAWLVAERSTCLRHHIGAVIIRDKRILTTGYNGAPAGVKDCLSLGCLRNELNIPSGQKHEICRAIHAEQNAIIQGGFCGINISGATLYCTHSPCILCAKMIINAGIKKVIVSQSYPDTSYQSLFKEAGIEFRIFQTESLSISRLK